MLPLNTISHIDITKGRDRKDFGKGFYLAVSKSQAIGMMHKKFREQTVRNLEIENLGIQYFIGKQEIADKLILSISEIS